MRSCGAVLGEDVDEGVRMWMTMLAPHERWLSALALPGGPATLAARVRECDSGGPIMGHKRSVLYVNLLGFFGILYMRGMLFITEGSPERPGI